VTANGKTNVFTRFTQWVRQIYQETVGELRKVHWPSRREAIILTRIVLIVLAVMTAILGTLDLLYSQIFKLLLGA
jgi:preprotein translocase subunit SecE